MADESASNRQKRPWWLTLLGALTVAGLVALPLLAGEAGSRELPDWVRFLGHFHPVVLHLPIGVLVLVLMQEIGAVFFWRGIAGQSLFPMFFAASSGVVAAIAGFLLYHGHAGDYAGEELADRHLWGGLAFAALAVLTFMVKAWTQARQWNPVWYRLLLCGSVAVMGFASHDGASLTHGSDYLTRYAPEPLRRVLGLPPSGRAATDARPADPLVYQGLVAPILERRCVECHKPGKVKGKLRMDTYEMLLKGGSEGPSIEPGNAAESNLIVRIELPEDDEEHMPPEGKPDIEAHELLLLKWWIDNGADPAKRLSEYEVPAEVRAAVERVRSEK